MSFFFTTGGRRRDTRLAIFFVEDKRRGSWLMYSTLHVLANDLSYKCFVKRNAYVVVTCTYTPFLVVISAYNVQTYLL